MTTVENQLFTGPTWHRESLSSSGTFSGSLTIYQNMQVKWRRISKEVVVATVRPKYINGRRHKMVIRALCGEMPLPNAPFGNQLKGIRLLGDTSSSVSTGGFEERSGVLSVARTEEGILNGSTPRLKKRRSESGVIAGRSPGNRSRPEWRPWTLEPRLLSFLQMMGSNRF
jgi:hypothetical protein